MLGMLLHISVQARTENILGKPAEELTQQLTCGWVAVDLRLKTGFSQTSRPTPFGVCKRFHPKGISVFCLCQGIAASSRVCSILLSKVKHFLPHVRFLPACLRPPFIFFVSAISSVWWPRLLGFLQDLFARPLLFVQLSGNLCRTRLLMSSLSRSHSQIFSSPAFFYSFFVHFNEYFLFFLLFYNVFSLVSMPICVRQVKGVHFVVS